MPFRCSPRPSLLDQPAFLWISAFAAKTRVISPLTPGDLWFLRGVRRASRRDLLSGAARLGILGSLLSHVDGNAVIELEQTRLGSAPLTDSPSAHPSSKRQQQPPSAGPTGIYRPADWDSTMSGERGCRRTLLVCVAALSCGEWTPPSLINVFYQSGRHFAASGGAAESDWFCWACWF